MYTIPLVLMDYQATSNDFSTEIAVHHETI